MTAAMMGLPYDGIVTRIAGNHKLSDIVRQILEAHKMHTADYDLICKQYWKGDVKATCDYIFEWCKKNLPYAAEPGSRQTSRSPGAIVALSKKVGADCKHYALWIAGVLDALRRCGYPVKWFFRFASYDDNKQPGHVFVVCIIDEKEYWIDPVLQYVNKRVPSPTHIKDKHMALDHISGIGALAPEYVGKPSVDILKDLVSNKPAITPPDFVPDVPGGVLDRFPSGGAGSDIKKSNIGLMLAGGLLLIYFLTKKRRK